MKIEKKDFSKTKKIKEIFKKKIGPLFGNNRSFSCKATPRKWKSNKQKMRLGNKSYILTPRIFKLISKQLKFGPED